MAKTASIKTNYFFNILLSYLDVLFPLVTAPYISRVLGAENLGKVNFANSVMGCFLVAAAYGTTTYGVRETAKVRDNPAALNRLFSELVQIKLLASIVFAVIYVFGILNLDLFRPDLVLYFILLPNLLINVINIDWFFQGIDNFKYITLRSGLMKLLCLILMFTIVKTPEHYTRYAGIIVFGLAGTCVLNYLYSRSFVKLGFRPLSLKNHPAIHIFFISSLLYTFYLLFDQILLFILADSASVAFLNRGKIIITMVTALITSLITVLLPKASSHYKTDRAFVNALFQKALGFIYITAIPCAVGLFCVAWEVMFLLGGEEFSHSSAILAALALTIPFTSLRLLLKNHYLIPGGREKFILISEALAVILYLAANLILIPKIGLWGCVTAIALYEAAAGLSALVFCKKKESFSLYSKSLLNASLGAAGILVTVFFIKSLGLHYMLTLGLCILAAAPVYAGILLLLGEETVKEGVMVVRKALRL